jgi:hypothetical protein
MLLRAALWCEWPFAAAWRGCDLPGRLTLAWRAAGWHVEQLARPARAADGFDGKPKRGFGREHSQFPFRVGCCFTSCGVMHVAADTAHRESHVQVAVSCSMGAASLPC